MATYYHGAQEIQPDGLQTLYLMNPGFPGYPDAPLPTNMILLNSAMSAISPPQHLVGIPVQATTPLPDSNQWSSMMPVNNSAGLSQKPEHGLSLSLSELPIPPSMSDEEVRVSSLRSVIMGSEYLKAARQLLEEVVNVGDGFKCGVVKGEDSKSHVKLNGNREAVDVGEESTNPTTELTSSERQELQMKKAKLISMLDEVEQRYKQYHNKMRLVVSSFEAAAGPGSAKTYTAFALQTISRQFRCLRDAITSQIDTATRGLGEEDCLLGGTQSKSSRHGFVDRHLRQRRALQQLGMIHHNCWRPQRGLPERSVSVLRAWLIEHFLHPYPKDSEKQMLAKQTGLTRSQVSNWFINARVRLWKPMVEEMYMEEAKEHEQSNANENSSSSSKSSADHENSPTNTYQTDPQPPLITFPPSADGELLVQPKQKRARSDECMSADGADHEYSLMASPTSHGLEFGEYPVGEIGRFGLEHFAPRFAGNGVSLTLGLTHYGGFSLSGAQPSYISSEGVPSRKMAVEVSTDNNGYAGLNNNASLAHPLNAYENISFQSTKLLPDFVA